MSEDKNKIEYISEDDTDGVDKKVKKVKDKFKLCEKERAEYLAGWQRAKADLINYKREQEQRISEYYKFANEGLILDILLVLDSFERALKHQSENEDGNDSLSQIHNQFKNILKSNGVEEIEAVGEKFNPEFHEAVGEVEAHPELAPSEVEGQSRGTESNIVIEEIQKGYRLHGKVIRPSKVKIGK